MKRGQPNIETLLARISDLEAENEKLKEFAEDLRRILGVEWSDLEEIFTNNGIELEEK